MRRRLFKIFAGGFLFGCIDWLILEAYAKLTQTTDYTPSSSFGQILLVILIIIFNYGIWLVPITAAVIYQMRFSEDKIKLALSGTLAWFGAMAGYYCFYTFMIMFIGLPHMEDLLIRNFNATGYWEILFATLRKVAFYQFVDWMKIVLLIGPILSLGIYYGVNFFKKIRKGINFQNISV